MAHSPLRWLIAAGVLLLMFGGSWLWFRPREAQVSDAAVVLTAEVKRDQVTVTVKNTGPDAIVAQRCTFHSFLSGGVEQPQYKPCAPQPVAITPGASVTDVIPITRWVAGEPVQVIFRYQVGTEAYTLTLPLPKP